MSVFQSYEVGDSEREMIRDRHYEQKRQAEEEKNKTKTDAKNERTIGGMLETGDIYYSFDERTKMRFECYEIALRSGFLSVDEIRRLEELPEQPELRKK